MATPIEKSVSAAPVFSEDLSPLPLDRPPDPPPDPPPDGTLEPLATSGTVKGSNFSVSTYEHPVTVEFRVRIAELEYFVNTQIYLDV